MSYDLRIWGRKASALKDLFPTTEGWREQSSGWVYSARSWQITIGFPQSVEPEDVPQQASELLPGLSVLVECSLEPVSAPKAAQSRLKAAALAVSGELAGLVEDPQESSLKSPRTSKRFIKPKREERITVLYLSWWYLNSPLRSVMGVSELLAILRKYLPEAIPRRYGLWEPPQHKTSESGLSALAEFIAMNIDNTPVLYPARPVVDIHVADCNGLEHPRLGFRSNFFEIGIEASALDQPGWEHASKLLWRNISKFLQPFYGEARFQSGYIMRGAATVSDIQTDVHPVRSWFWRGIPSKPGIAVVLGHPYDQIWNLQGVVHEEGLLFKEQHDWSSRAPLPIAVPRGIAQPWDPAWVEAPDGGFSINWCDQPSAEFPF